jgi:hypothetical protein
MRRLWQAVLGFTNFLVLATHGLLKLCLSRTIDGIEWHADEFKRRSSFTYTVIDPEMSGCAGCVYVYPPTRVGYDVELFMWLRSDRYSTDREVHFRSELKDWICGVWHFNSIGMPGCEVSWQEWNTFRSNNRAMPSP